MNAILSIDWLSLYCIDCEAFEASESYDETFEAFAKRFYTSMRDYEESDFYSYRSQGFFDIRSCGYGSKVFKFAFDVFFSVGGERYKFAHVQMCPRSEVINRNAVNIKVDNYILYKFRSSGELYPIIERFLSILRFKFVNVSRIDLCCDFVYFANGMSPVELIQGVCDGTFRRISKNRSAKCTFVKGWNAKTHNYEWQTLRFGSHGSIVSAYLYNKSIEIDEVSGKGYICDVWRSNGLAVDASESVWRLEFSIDGEYFNKSYCEACDVSLKQALSSEFVKTYFDFLVKHMFDIRVCSSGRVGTWQKLCLLTFDNLIYTINVNLRGKVVKTNRTDKIVLKYLTLVNSRVDGFTAGDDALYSATRAVIPLLLSATRLGDWYKQKMLYVNSDLLCCNDDAGRQFTSNAISENKALKRRNDWDAELF